MDNISTPNILVKILLLNQTNVALTHNYMSCFCVFAKAANSNEGKSQHISLS